MAADVVRGGAERAIIEGIFDISAELAQAHGANDGGDGSLVGLLAEIGAEIEDNQLILSREVTASGRSASMGGWRRSRHSSASRAGWWTSTGRART